jgi:2-polyprenyl-3-methyl-5-hydroxy-6-metoxy-1,4-benzoquinol methylase
MVGIVDPDRDLDMKRAVISKLKWNNDSRDWEGLTSDDQRPRYEAIAGIIQEFCPSGAVLDVGCGEAILAGYLPRSVSYTGIDRSAKAAALASTKVLCHHVNAEDFASGDERWDCIVFNEMLYYSDMPQALLLKFSRLLRSNGIIIISIFQKRDHSLRAMLGFSMSNARCTRVVKELIAAEQWTVEREREIEQPGAEPWLVLVVRPAAHRH